MAYFVKANLFGKDYFVGYPQHEFKCFGDGTTFEANIWPDRKSDCRVNGALVNEIVYRRSQREYDRRRAAK